MYTGIIVVVSYNVLKINIEEHKNTWIQIRDTDKEKLQKLIYKSHYQTSYITLTIKGKTIF